MDNNSLTLNGYKMELLGLNKEHTRNLATENSYNIEDIEHNDEKLDTKV